MWKKHLKEETKKKLSEVQTGISKPNSGKRKEYLVISPEGNVISVFGLRKFCREKEINHSMFWRVVTGKQKEYNGWKFYAIDKNTISYDCREIGVED